MGDPRVKIFLKLFFDCVFLFAVLSVYFIEVFEYKDDYYVGIVRMLKETTYRINATESTPLTQITVATYSEFDDHFCDSPVGDLKDVCDKRKGFEEAGIVFLVFGCLSQALVVYGIFGLIGMACGCTCCGFLRMTLVHYIFPAVYGIGILCFVVISKVFELDDMAVQPGIIVMFGAEVLGFGSMVYFLCYRKEMKTLVFAVTEDYEQIKK